MTHPVPDWLTSTLGCASAGAAGLVAARLGSAQVIGRAGFKLSSAAFRHGEEMDPSFTADEEDAVAPPLEWTAPPPGTQELVLVVEDADASNQKAGGDRPFCHWLVWGLPGQKGQLLEGEAPPRVGKNAFGNSEWLLPDPPTGAAPHHYVFQMFALDLPLVLMPGARREELESAMQGHVIGLALLTASYAREEGGDYDWDDDDAED